MSDYTILTEEERENIRNNLEMLLVFIISSKKIKTAGKKAEAFINIQRKLGEDKKTFKEKKEYLVEEQKKIL